LISEVLKLAIQKKIISESDLFKTDLEVIKKLKESKDKDILDILNKISCLNVVDDEKNYAYHLKSKVRCTDPKILIDNEVTRLSKIDKSYKELMNDYISKSSNGFFVRFIRK
jgi:hypothetical protein